MCTIEVSEKGRGMEKFWEILKIIYENITKDWLFVLLVYGWVLLFIPSLIASYKKNTEKWYDNDLLRTWGLKWWCCILLFFLFELMFGAFFIDFMIFNIFTFAIWLPIFKKAERKIDKIYKMEWEQERKEAEEKEQNRLNEIGNDLNEIGSFTPLIGVAEKSTIEDKGSFDIGNMLDEIEAENKKEE